MKKTIFLITMLIHVLVVSLEAQNQLNSSVSLNFTYPSNPGVYMVGDQIELDYSAFNLSNHDIFLNGNFELRTGGSLAFESTIESQTLLPNGVETNGILVFTFPEECDLEAGDYQLHLVINYAHDWLGSPVTTNTFVDFNIICNDLAIPIGQPGTSEECDLEVFDLSFEPDPTCCPTVPDITFNTTYNPGQIGQACAIDVMAMVDFGQDMIYGIRWNTGQTSSSITHTCGIKEYFLVVTWFENGNICSITSEPIRVKSLCECDAFSDNVSTEPIDKGQRVHQSNNAIFPNPNSGSFYLNTAKGTKLQHFEIYTILGKRLATPKTFIQGDQMIHLPQLEKGTYFIRLHYDKRPSETHQFIIH